MGGAFLRRRRLVALLMPVGLLAALLVMAQHGWAMPAPAALYVAVVVGSVLLGCLGVGLVSAVLVSAHALWSSAAPGSLWPSTMDGALQVGTVVATTPAVALLVGLWRRQADRARQAAQRDAAAWRGLTQSTAEAIVLADGQGCICLWNRGAQAIFGYAADEVVGQPWVMLLPERDREAYRRDLERAVCGQAAPIGTVLEGQGLRKDGGEFPLEASLATWTTPDGRFYSGIIRDISQRKLAEAALRRAYDELEQRVEERTAELTMIDDVLEAEIAARTRIEAVLHQQETLLRGLVDNSTAVIYVKGLDGRYLLVNRHFERLFNVSLGQLQGKTDHDIFPQGFADVLRANDQRVLEAGRALEWEEQVPQADGVHTYISIKFPLCDASGMPFALCGISTDISARKRAEQALQQYAARLQILRDIDRAILRAQSPDAVAEAALGHIAALIPSWRIGISLFDWQARQGLIFAAVGAGVSMFPVGRRISLAEYGQRDLEVLQRGEAYSVPDVLALAAPPAPVRALQAQGLRSYVRIPLMAGGALIGSLNLWSDRPGAFTAEQVEIAREVADQLAISIQQARLHEEVQRYAAELEARVAERTAQLREINAELEAFAYSVSHDLRTPLRAMQGFGRALLEDYAEQLDATAQGYVQRIVAAAQRMDALIEDLLAYSRLSRAELRLQAASLAAVVAEVLAQLEPEIQARQARVWTEGSLASVMAHPATLQQVVANLVANAIKFVAPGVQPQVRLWGEALGERYRLWVEDNGIGIAPEYQERVFRLFERLHAGQAYPGTGIGLAIVSKGVERMGGRVGVESEVGKGSRFWIELPRLQDDSAAV
jgi:PAS domain S-box-containing protein